MGPAGPAHPALASVAVWYWTETARALGRCRQVTLFRTAVFSYSDGIGTIIKMATACGSQIGLGTGALISALPMVQFVGVPFTFAGALAHRIGARNGIMLALMVYSAIAVLGVARAAEAALEPAPGG